MSANRLPETRTRTVRSTVGIDDATTDDDHGAATETDPGLNLKQVALALGVHYMTAYRYVRLGHLPAGREGNEWRVSRAAVELFLERGSVIDGPSGDAPLAGSRDVDWAGRLVSRLLAGDETAAWRVIEAALAAGRSPTYCYLDMVAAALQSIGDRWSEGALGVADQHVATAVAVRLVSRLGARFRRPGRTRGTTVFGAPLGEMHSLPIAIVSDLVRLSGYDVLELGANVPPEAFVSSVLRAPRLICVGLGLAQIEFLDAAQTVVDAIREVDRDVPIVLGGLAAADRAAEALTGINALACTGREAVAIVERFAVNRVLRQVG